MPKDSIFLDKKETAILDVFKIYHEKSTIRDSDPEKDYAGYNPLFCAIYDGKPEDVNTLISYYFHSKELKEILTDSKNDMQENILHIAMKHAEIFSICCKKLVEKH